MKIKFTFIALLLSSATAFAQQVCDFSTGLFLAPDSYNDGSSGSGNFINGNAVFNNTYNTSWMYWESGFAYSNQADTTVSPSDYMTQLYRTKAGTDHSSIISGGPDYFGIGKDNAGAKLIFPAYGVQGMYVTNTTYAYNSMALGDAFGKKFGDSTSTHSAVGVNEGYPDWFKLSILGYYAGTVTDTVDFYLADFRFADDSLDYIVKDWEYVDLSPLGVYVDSLVFLLTSSDVGAFGMNTPGYFCIDDMQTMDFVTGIAEQDAQLNVSAYPNPFENTVTISFENTNSRMISVYNSSGALVYNEETQNTTVELSMEAFSPGIYFVKVIEGDRSSTLRMIKKQ